MHLGLVPVGKSISFTPTVFSFCLLVLVDSSASVLRTLAELTTMHTSFFFRSWTGFVIVFEFITNSCFFTSGAMMTRS